jgi:hypothetical protein
MSQRNGNREKGFERMVLLGSFRQKDDYCFQAECFLRLSRSRKVFLSEAAAMIKEVVLLTS